MASNDEEALRQFVSVGPVATGICGTDQRFMFYESGIFDVSDCCQTLNHAVMLVGYGMYTTRASNSFSEISLGVAYPNGQTEGAEGIPYWLLRNSWSKFWGEGGYMRVKRKRGLQHSPFLMVGQVENGIARSGVLSTEFHEGLSIPPRPGNSISPQKICPSSTFVKKMFTWRGKYSQIP